MSEFESLTDQLDQIKRKADTRDQYSTTLSSLQKKGDPKIRAAIEKGDIEAAGFIVEFHEGEYVPLFCVLFSDMVVGCVLKKDMTVARVRWCIDLHSAYLARATREIGPELGRKLEITNDYIILTELRCIHQEPFSQNFTFELFPTKAPYDMGFWYNSILTVVSSLWFDNKVLLSNSYRFRRHIEDHLFPLSQWRLIQLAGSEQTFHPGEVIIHEVRHMIRRFWH
jgi:hypothetical protein